MQGSGSRLIRNTAHRNAVGVRLLGQGNILVHTTARNNDVGIDLFDTSGQGNVIISNTAVDNGRGFDVAADANATSAHLLLGNVAKHNASEGFYLRGFYVSLLQNQAARNGTEGYRVDGTHTLIINNVAKRNGGDGILIEAPRAPRARNVVQHNVAKHNEGAGIALRCNMCSFPSGRHIVTANIARGHLGPDPDLVDEYPACDANQWSGNAFDTRSQECIH